MNIDSSLPLMDLYAPYKRYFHLEVHHRCAKAGLLTCDAIGHFEITPLGAKYLYRKFGSTYARRDKVNALKLLLLTLEG